MCRRAGGVPACLKKRLFENLSKYPSVIYRWKEETKCNTLVQKSSQKKENEEIVAVLVNGVDDVIIFTDVRTSAINDVTMNHFDPPPPPVLGNIK